MKRCLASAAVALSGLAFAASGASDLFQVQQDLIENTPSDFPRFYFAGHDTEAQWLSRYLWYFFRSRVDVGKVMFNREYLTTSDLWLGGAVTGSARQPVQREHRDALLAIRFDPEGYVWTHQHFSHAHEHGWPFPMWTQSTTGFTAGWHFQKDGPGWVWDSLRKQPDSPFAREKAIRGWELENVRSLGISDNKWQLESTGGSPAIVTPASVAIDACNAPFLQLCWTRSPAPPANVLPYVEWMREGDSGFSPERRVYFGFDTGEPAHEQVTGATHSLIDVYRHPLWKGCITRVRIALAPGESNVRFAIDSFFTTFDTRHTINNPIYVLASANYYRWTGDVAFLRASMNRIRTALRFQQSVMGGLKYNFIRNPWVGHDGLPGWVRNADGTLRINRGHGIGNNYWDIMPFGGDDMYATAQYYASLLAMADLEQAVAEHPGWDVPQGADALDQTALRNHAAQVKDTANKKFWNPQTGRFYGCIDVNGVGHEYGFTFLNLDAIWYGIASPEHALAIMAWISGKRVVEGDTSTGEDIYRWKFGPRATTRRNLDWYGEGWTKPESIPWGRQVQDGGAVLGFAFYDYWARLNVLGPEDAWQRLVKTLEWEREVWAEGGYRKYYESGKHGNTMQGSNTAGGIGVDMEFLESSLVPSIVTYGFLGLQPDANALGIRPRLPKSVPEMGITNVLYRGVRLDVKAAENRIEVALKDDPRDAIRITLAGPWKRTGTAEVGSTFELKSAGVYRFER